jgi:hypothetical protein
MDPVIELEEPDNGKLPVADEVKIEYGDQPKSIFGISLPLSRDLFNILWMGFGFFLIVSTFIGTQVSCRRPSGVYLLYKDRDCIGDPVATL